MLDLPQSTTIQPERIIFKKNLYQAFPKELSGKNKDKFNQDIKKIVISNELSERSLNISATEDLKAIYVVRVELKNKNYDESNIQLIAKLLRQNVILLLTYKDEIKLSLYETKLLSSDWFSENYKLDIRGIDLKSVWENFVTQITNIEIETGNTLQEQLELEEEKARLKKLIEVTERKARRERQSKKRFELFKEIERYKEKLEEL